MFSSRSFLARFREFNARERLIRPGDTVIAAVSGGVDSMTLLEVLVRERGGLGAAVEVAHVNHALRGDASDADEAFVRERAERFGVPFHCTRVDTAAAARESAGGLQLAARKLRYRFFGDVRAGRRDVKIATAHHADDNAETVLMNLLRGSGVRGLGGIPVRRDDQGVVRPLLFAERNEIEAFAAAEGVPHRMDRSNDGDDYTRNVIRRHVMPAVRERVSPSVARTLLRESRHFRSLDGYCTQEAVAALDRVRTSGAGDGIALSADGLAALHPFLRTLVVLRAVEECTGRAAGSAVADAVADLVRKPTGSLHTVAGAFVALRDRGTIVLRPSPAAPPVERVLVPGETYDGAFFAVRTTLRDGGTDLLSAREPGEELVDADLIPAGAVVLRTWRPGDAFMPLGMQALKKVSDYFVGARVPRVSKGEFPLLTTTDGSVVCLCGHRIDDRFKVTPATRRVLSIEFRRKADHPDGIDHNAQR